MPGHRTHANQRAIRLRNFLTNLYFASSSIAPSSVSPRSVPTTIPAENSPSATSSTQTSRTATTTATATTTTTTTVANTIPNTLQLEMNPLNSQTTEITNSLLNSISHPIFSPHPSNTPPTLVPNSTPPTSTTSSDPIRVSSFQVHCTFRRNNNPRDQDTQADTLADTLADIIPESRSRSRSRSTSQAQPISSPQNTTTSTPHNHSPSPRVVTSNNSYNSNENENVDENAHTHYNINNNPPTEPNSNSTNIDTNINSQNTASFLPVHQTIRSRRNPGFFARRASHRNIYLATQNSRHIRSRNFDVDPTRRYTANSSQHFQPTSNPRATPDTENTLITTDSILQLHSQPNQLNQPSHQAQLSLLQQQIPPISRSARARPNAYFSTYDSHNSAHAARSVESSEILTSRPNNTTYANGATTLVTNVLQLVHPNPVPSLSNFIRRQDPRREYQLRRYHQLQNRLQQIHHHILNQPIPQNQPQNTHSVYLGNSRISGHLSGNRNRNIFGNADSTDESESENENGNENEIENRNRNRTGNGAGTQSENVNMDVNENDTYLHSTRIFFDRPKRCSRTVLQVKAACPTFEKKLISNPKTSSYFGSEIGFHCQSVTTTADLVSGLVCLANMLKLHVVDYKVPQLDSLASLGNIDGNNINNSMNRNSDSNENQNENENENRVGTNNEDLPRNTHFFMGDIYPLSLVAPNTDCKSVILLRVGTKNLDCKSSSILKWIYVEGTKQGPLEGMCTEFMIFSSSQKRKCSDFFKYTKFTYEHYDNLKKSIENSGPNFNPGQPVPIVYASLNQKFRYRQAFSFKDGLLCKYLYIVVLKAEYSPNLNLNTSNIRSSSININDVARDYPDTTRESANNIGYINSNNSINSFNISYDGEQMGSQNQTQDQTQAQTQAQNAVSTNMLMRLPIIYIGGHSGPMSFCEAQFK